MSSQWQRVEDLFYRAAALAPLERDRFLTQACGSDTELRQEIESLLENDRSKGDLLGPTIAKTLDRILAASGEPGDDLIGTQVGPYGISGLIGAGGMGRVYAADDSRLGRRVALKVLPARLGEDPVALERFRREARILSALNHPNICTIFDVLDSDDHTFIVMEYIDGAPLRGPVSFDIALKYALQICDALDAAHRKGFIHHDLKPANIQVTESGIKLLDFGLARIARTQDEATRTMAVPGAPPVLSRTGVIMGTPAYMSPEQADGKAVDQRSDIFALGAVLYELVTGRRAFQGDSTAAVISAVLRDEPPPFDAPPALARVVTRCLKKQPEERFQTTAQVKAALAQIGTGALESQPSVAVLPFVNLSADKEDEYFSDGLAEEIINALAHVPGLKVIARTSAFAFRGKEQDVRQIAEALGARTVLEGRVRRSLNRIRITAQLIDAVEGTHLWSDRFDRELTDVFAIQDEIAVAIAAALKVTLATPNRRRPSRETEDKEAHQLYLRGRYLQNQRRPELLRKGIECFERAVERDPDYALPYAGLSDLLCITGFWGRDAPATILPRAIAAATKALTIDDSLGEAHAALAFARDVHYWDWAGGDGKFERAIQLNPNSPLGHTWYSYHLSILGRHNEAIEQARMGVDLDPLSTSVNFGAVRAYFFGRRYEEAIAQGRRGLELGSGDFPTLLVLGESYLQKGVVDEAVRACKESVAASDRHPVALGSLGHVYGLSGMQDEAVRIIEELKQASQVSYVPPASIANAYLGLGLFDESLSWLGKAWEDRSTTLPYLVCHPTADRFQSNSRFQDLRRRMNLAQ